ncbi:hypothetical protein [Azospirillum sp. sgz302134]
MIDALGQLKLLDTAIGLAFIYLLLSVLTTAIVEIIAAALRLRHINLVQGLVWLLQTSTKAPAQGAAPPAQPAEGSGTEPTWREWLDRWRATWGWRIMGQRRIEDASLTSGGETSAAPKDSLAYALLNHPLIHRLAPGERVPAYIPSNLFAAALIDLLASDKDVTMVDKDGKPVPNQPQAAFGNVAELIDKIPYPELKDMLRPVVTQAQVKAVKAEDAAKAAIQAIEDWFDQSMDRVSGWYKQRIQFVTLAVAFLVAFALNVDTIGISTVLWRDDALRAALVKTAVDTSKDDSILKNPCAATDKDKPVDQLECLGTRIVQLNDDVNRKLGGVPIGWSETAAPHDLGSFILHLLGWLLSAFALSLGAPFWFDLLSRFVRLRGTGPKPDGDKGGAGQSGTAAATPRVG